MTESFRGHSRGLMTNIRGNFSDYIMHNMYHTCTAIRTEREENTTIISLNNNGIDNNVPKTCSAGRKIEKLTNLMMLEGRATESLGRSA